MSREKQLSPRLEANLDAIFDTHPDPFSLYWKIAADLDPSALELVQKRIRRILQRKGEIGPESAVLLACVLHLTGFPAHRLMHFLSLYLPGGISLSLFDFAVGAIFLDGVPVPEQAVYDMSRYTYLEKRLLARKSLEISARLKDSLSPGVLLFLYLLSLRDDLSNENVQLIGLVMKNCFPALGVPTRLGAASLEEYGDLARAWKRAEARSIAAEAEGAGGGDRKPVRAFERETASAFLDKYFSDAALEEMRAAAPPPVRKPRSAPAKTDTPREPPREEAAPLPSVDTKRARQAPKTGAAPPDDQTAPSPPVLKPRRAPQAGEAGRAAAAPLETAQRAAPSPARAPTAARARRTRTALPPVPSVERPRTSPPVPAAERPRTPASAEAPARPVPQRDTVSPRRPAKPRQKRAGGARPSPLPFLLAFAPLLLAAVVTAGALFAARPWAWTSPTPAASAATAAAPAASTPSGSATPTTSGAAPGTPEGAPSTTPYVVRPGDSLWKIFLSQGDAVSDGKGWVDFLSSARTLNKLGDPDNIKPGKVLSIVRPVK